MRSVAPTLLTRQNASSLVARFSASSTSARLHLTPLPYSHNYRLLSTLPTFPTMPPPPPPPHKRRWNRSRGGAAAGNGNNARGANAPSPASQQPKRPRVEPATESPSGPIDIRAMYSTSAGGAEPKRYAEMAGTLHPALLQSLNKMGFEFMSPVQQKVLTELPPRGDCIVQAKTGTGKTVGFLLPAMQNILAGDAPPRGKVGILVICPTRELALQIAKEAKDLAACLPRKMECHTAFGGTARASNLNAFLQGDPTILVATPGRLDDILGEEQVRERFTHVKTVVLDEADQMLDQGFAPAVKKILTRIAPKSIGWQGMCFSATMNNAIMDVAKCVLAPGYTTLSTVDPNEVPTHERVPQFAITVPSVNDTFAALMALVEQEYNQNPTDFKAIVFGTTANGVGLLYDLYKVALPQFALYELHSRMSQSARTKTTAAFKDAKSGILVASDVVGRGMDFPNVGLVIQLGLPSSNDQYVHRVGRTARAGKDGRAVIILSEKESFFPKVNKALPIQQYPVDVVSQLPKHAPTINKSFTRVTDETKAKAYQAFLGYNKTFLNKLRLSPPELVQIANGYAATMGCREPPMIDKRVVGKMGLKGVGGLNVGTLR